MIPEKVKSLLNKNEIIFLATSSKENNPNVVCVSCQGIFNDKILIGKFMLNKTLSNLQENNKISIILTNDKEYYQIKGTAECFESGKWFEKVLELNKGSEYTPSGAVLISPKEIYDLSSCKKIL
jgi:predicted pyridoxine 5'-phosphate oxidase superfamily flavin-nucleotide-binding protein